jgi:hypothetical protein
MAILSRFHFVCLSPCLAGRKARAFLQGKLQGNVAITIVNPGAAPLPQNPPCLLRDTYIVARIN